MFLNNLNRWKVIDDLVFSAKLGDKLSFTTLWNMYNELLFKRICLSFTSIYPFLKGTEFNIFQNYYIYLWDAINAYDFEKDEGFSYYLKCYFIDKTRLMLKKEYNLQDKFIVSSQTVREMLKAHNRKSDQEIAKIKRYMNAIRTLTPTQLRVVYYFYYCRIDHTRFAKILKINRTTAVDRLNDVYKKMRKNYHLMRIKDKKGKLVEKEKPRQMFYKGQKLTKD